jgi:class 3 adenylate cyclase
VKKGWHERNGVQVITDIVSCDESSLDFTLPIQVEGIPPESEVSCRNTLSLLRYLQKVGRNVTDQDLSDHGFSHRLDHFMDPHKWIGYPEALRFFDFVRLLTNTHNPRLLLDIGRQSHRWQSFGPGVDALANFLPLSKVMFLTAEYSRMFNNGQFLRSVRGSRGNLTVISKYSERVNAIRTVDQEWWALGIYSGFPERRALAPAEVSLQYSVCGLETLLDREYAWLGIREHQIRSEWTFLGLERRQWVVEGLEYAHEVALLRESLVSGKKPEGEDLFHPEPRDLEEFSPQDFEDLSRLRMVCKVWLVTRSLQRGREVVVARGEIWGAPYTRFQVSWKEQALFRSLVERAKNWRREWVVSQQALHREIVAAKVEAMHTEQERLASERKSEVFRTYARRTLVDRIDRGEDPRTDRPRRQEMTVLFCDMCGFTDHASHLSPEDTVSLLNSYFNRLNRSLFHQRGEIDKIMGDGLMATFENVPGLEQDVLRAVQAAVSMRWELQRYNRERRQRHGSLPARGIPFRRIDNGIGIASGDVVTGNIGSDHKLDHTLIGDVVNVASRLERLTRHYGSAILVTEDVRFQLPERFTTRFLDMVRVRGRAVPLRIHEIYDHEPVRVRELKGMFQERMAQAWSLYAGGLFSEAASMYEEIRREVGPHRLEEGRCLDPAVDFFLQRCRMLQRMAREDPLWLDSWDGVHLFEEK